MLKKNEISKQSKTFAGKFKKRKYQPLTHYHFFTELADLLNK